MKSKPSQEITKKQAPILAAFLLGLFLNPKNGGSSFI
jgi:hypothetical protein